MLTRPYFYPGSINASLHIENHSPITNCHKYYVVFTLYAFPDDRKGKNLGFDRVSNILIKKKKPEKYFLSFH